jgi:hypothetical protein
MSLKHDSHIVKAAMVKEANIKIAIKFLLWEKAYGDTNHES